ncbi:hypothetical protein BKA80DRAFT_132472 [Phyllosticta citrichinensis]
MRSLSRLVRRLCIRLFQPIACCPTNPCRSSRPPTHPALDSSWYLQRDKKLKSLPSCEVPKPLLSGAPAQRHERDRGGHQLHSSATFDASLALVRQRQPSSSSRHHKPGPAIFFPLQALPQALPPARPQTSTADPAPHASPLVEALPSHPSASPELCSIFVQ